MAGLFRDTKAPPILPALTGDSTAGTLGFIAYLPCYAAALPFCAAAKIVLPVPTTVRAAMFPVSASGTGFRAVFIPFFVTNKGLFVANKGRFATNKGLFAANKGRFVTNKGSSAARIPCLPAYNGL